MLRGILLAPLILAATSCPAAAQGGDEETSRALFEQGRKLLRQRDCGAAIPKLKESLAYHRSIGAHLSLAECYEKNEPITAWRENKEAQRLAIESGDDRAAYAEAKAVALEPRLALVRVEMRGSAADVTSLSEIRLDTIVVEDFYRRSPIAVAPGSHVIEVAVPGKRTWRQQVVATVGATVVANVSFEDEAIPPRPANSGPAPADDGRTQRTAGLVTGVVGGAGIAISLIAGLATIAQKGSLSSRCSINGGSFPDNCGNGSLDENTRNDVQADTRTMNTWATVSTVSFVIGALALGAGAVLYLTAPRRRPAVALTPAALMARF